MRPEHLARRHRIGDPRRRSQVVLEHLEGAVAVAHHVEAGDRDPRADVLAHAHQSRLVVRGAVEAARRHDAGSHDPPLAVHVPDEQLERPHALGHAVGEHAPFRGRRSRGGSGRCETACSPSAEPNETPRSLASRATAALSSPRSSPVDRLPHAAIVLGRVPAGYRALLEGEITPHGCTLTGGAALGVALGPLPRRAAPGRSLDRGVYGGHESILGAHGALVVRPTSKMTARDLDEPAGPGAPGRRS